MRVEGYIALHYGLPYVREAIRSIIDDVDALHVLYSPIGSHGHYTSQRCPETELDLQDAVRHAAGRKLKTWLSGVWPYEGAQRDTIFHITDADIIVVLDYDEIWQPGLLPMVLDQAETSDVREWRVPFRHYWRSFYRCILHDPSYPVRVFNRRGREKERTADVGQNMAINHFGYAIPVSLMRYKWQVHGHKSQLRRDVDYFRDVYEANRQTDTHPVGSTAWNPETVDPFAEGWLPAWMLEHPYAKLEVIP